MQPSSITAHRTPALQEGSIEIKLAIDPIPSTATDYKICRIVWCNDGPFEGNPGLARDRLDATVPASVRVSRHGHPMDVSSLLCISPNSHWPIWHNQFSTISQLSFMSRQQVVSHCH